MKRVEYLCLALAFASTGLYLVFASTRGSPGFALDDAWIHQVYARNLGTTGEFAFFRGQPSAGSTSPLWTIALAIAYLTRTDALVWTYLLGTLLTGASAILAARLAARLNLPSPAPILIALFLLLEWHLTWSAVSGMEIPLYVFLSLLLLERFYARANALLLGIVAGLLTLTRPEGIVLGGLVGVGMVWNGLVGASPAEERRQEGGHPRVVSGRDAVPLRAFAYLAGLGILLAPYLLFNVAVSGTLLPNTFYAKNVEYAELLASAPFLLRWLQLFWVPWTGAQVLLLPGFLFVAVALAVRREWTSLIPVVWAIGLPALYALRLPVAYQHGRYEMPVVPFLIMYGTWGTSLLFERLRYWVVKAVWAGAAAALVIIFWFLGANAYANDVAIINCEMVGAAKWVAANVPANTLVAAHDIGALGYYYNGPLIDLAGLVTPDVIPFIRDQSRLRDYILSRGATLMVFFPDWYPELNADPHLQAVHRQDCPVARDEGGTDMAVYQVRP